MMLVKLRLSISLQEYIGRNLQVLLQTYDIVRGQYQIESCTTMCETLNALVTLEVKRWGVYGFEHDFFLGIVHRSDGFLGIELSVGKR